jgi:hypothetical protein
MLDADGCQFRAAFLHLKEMAALLLHHRFEHQKRGNRGVPKIRLRVCCRILSRLIIKMNFGAVIMLPFNRAEGHEGAEGAEGFSRERLRLSDCHAYHNPVPLMLSVPFCTYSPSSIRPCDAPSTMAQEDEAFINNERCSHPRMLLFFHH